MVFRQLCAVNLVSGEMQVRRIPANIPEYPTIAIANNVVWFLLSADFGKDRRVPDDKFVFAKWNLPTGSCCEVCLKWKRHTRLDARDLYGADILLSPSGDRFSLVFYGKRLCFTYTTTLTSPDEQGEHETGDFDLDESDQFRSIRPNNRGADVMARRTNHDGDYEFPFDSFPGFDAKRGNVTLLSRLKFEDAVPNKRVIADGSTMPWWAHRPQLWKDTRYSYSFGDGFEGVFVQSPQL